jgi:hypothetical protein
MTNTDYNNARREVNEISVLTWEYYTTLCALGMPAEEAFKITNSAQTEIFSLAWRVQALARNDEHNEDVDEDDNYN